MFSHGEEAEHRLSLQNTLVDIAGSLLVGLSHEVVHRAVGQSGSDGIVDTVQQRLVALDHANGAYVSEIIRAGIQSVDGGQTEAARSLGLTQGQNMRFIVLPQAVKNILPAIGNEFVTIIKESAITYTIGVQDLMAAVKAAQAGTFLVLEPLLVVAVLYFCLTFPTSKVIAYFERRMSRGDKR